MILSMTGYGKASSVYGDKKITAEIKSLNSKTLDLSVRMANCYREKEMELRSMIAERLVRGKVEFSLWIERDEVEQAATLNMPLMQKYIEQFHEANQNYGIPVPENIFYDGLVCGSGHRLEVVVIFDLVYVCPSG